jgi:hypothetical protein
MPESMPPSLRSGCSPCYGDELLAESPVRDVLCPGCFVGWDTPAESAAALSETMVLSPGSVGIG